MKVVLAGRYPAGTYDKIKKMLPQETFDVIEVNTEETYHSMTDAEIIILRIFKAPRAVIERNTNLKMILRWGAGFDSVDIEAAGEHGVLVTNTPGANAGAVSELATLFMLAVGRKLLCHEDSLRKGEWTKNTFLNSSFTLNNKTVGIIGAGNIGRQVARKVQAFGASTQYYDLYRLKPEMEREYNLTYKPLKELIKNSDIITLHIPLTEENHHIIGKTEIAMMKDGAIIINTARGELVDDQALVEAVNSGKLAGAGLDVVENEPLPANDPLLCNPNIIVTPHIGGGTADIGDVIIPILVKDIEDYVAGAKVIHIVNKKYLR